MKSQSIHIKPTFYLVLEFKHWY